MNRIDEQRYNDIRQPKKETRMDVLKSVLLDNYWLWALYFIGFAIVLAYPNTIWSLLNGFIGIPSWLYRIISSLSLPLILIIIGIGIFVIGHYRASKKAFKRQRPPYR